MLSDVTNKIGFHLKRCDRCIAEFDEDQIVQCDELPGQSICFDCWVEFGTEYEKFCWAFIHYQYYIIEKPSESEDSEGNENKDEHRLYLTN